MNTLSHTHTHTHTHTHSPVENCDEYYWGWANAMADAHDALGTKQNDPSYAWVVYRYVCMCVDEHKHAFIRI
jgi:hypothetical protein